LVDGNLSRLDDNISNLKGELKAIRQLMEEHSAAEKVLADSGCQTEEGARCPAGAAEKEETVDVAIQREQTGQANSSESEPIAVSRIAPTSRVNPNYPPQAQEHGIEGYVELQFIIRPDGSVDRSSIQVLDSRPNTVFDSASEKAIARWKFEPTSEIRRSSTRIEFQLR
jgi:protein TonB